MVHIPTEKRAPRAWRQRLTPGCRGPARFALALLFFALVSPFARAADGEAPGPGDGPVAAEPRTVPAALVSLPLPITDARDKHVKAAVVRAVESLDSKPGERGVLVIRFDGADEQGGAASEFGRALDLARFLAGPELARVKTVAWLPEGARGHALLVALACEEIVTARDALLGEANASEPSVDAAMRAAYADIAGRRGTAQPALAVALLDPQARALRVSTDDGEYVVDAAELAELKKSAVILREEPLRPVPLKLDGGRARELGLVSLLAKSRDELARGLGVSPESLAGDPSLQGGWKAIRVVLAGPVTAEAVARVKKSVASAVEGGKNFVCLEIESAGGDPTQSVELAKFLASQDPQKVRTVAWVPREARSDAALVATACDNLVMAPEAVLGGGAADAITERQGEAIKVGWRASVARERERSWSLPVALVVPGIVVRQETREATGQVRYLCDEELAERDDADAWHRGAQVGVGPIVLNGKAAESLGLALHVVDGFDDLAEEYGVEGPVAVSAPGWADILLDALASPGVAWILLLVGAAGLYIELHTPGIGLGGFVSMVAFIVYFWSQHLHGTSGWLEVMLFLAGLFCVAAEIFVLPGVGILGLGGGLLMIAALVLASQSFILPTTADEMRQVQTSLLGILGAAAGVTVMAVTLNRWLPRSRFFGRVLLEPPSDDEVHADADPLEALVGIAGVTTTRLAPAGKARIDGVLHDVVSDGQLLEPASAVTVVAVRGGRLVVRADEDGAGGPPA